MEPTTIVVVTHDARRFIELCIKGIHLNTKGPYHFIVIDNGSEPRTIKLLSDYSSRGWFTLICRNIPKRSSSHAASLDWFFKNHKVEKFVCLLDSDSCPVMEDWLGKLHILLKDYDAIGCVHFRDEKLLHPSCMLFNYSSFLKAGSPSFAINGSLNGVFNDTGMTVCKRMISTGSRLLPLSREEMGKYVKHRWCGTRVEIAPGSKIDDYTKERFEKDTNTWFSDPNIQRILES